MAFKSISTIKPSKVIGIFPTFKWCYMKKTGADNLTNREQNKKTYKQNSEMISSKYQLLNSKYSVVK